MARRTLLTPAQRAALLALPTDRAELARHYTLSEAELTAIKRRRRRPLPHRQETRRAPAAE